MAVTEGVGHSRVLHRRRWEDYRSLKQYHQNSRITEVIIEGSTTTAGALTEISFVTGDIMIYTTESQVYVRTEGNDTARQSGKYVYLEYQDDTGQIMDIVTADLAAADTTTEVIFTGADDFYRARQFYSEVASGAAGVMILLTDDAMAAGEEWAFISDNQTHFALQRFFTQPEATCKSYLGKIKISGPVQDGDGAVAGYLLGVQYTPKALNLGEAQGAATITQTRQFDGIFEWEPCIELAGGTEVIFTVGDMDSPADLHIEAIMLEVYDI